MFVPKARAVRASTTWDERRTLSSANDEDAPRVENGGAAAAAAAAATSKGRGFDAEATTGGNETSSFEGHYELARRVAEQARQCADDEDLDGRGGNTFLH